MSTKKRLSRLMKAAGALAVLGALCPQASRAQQPSWLSSATIYCVYPEIFSSSGNLAAVTAKLSSLHSLGVNVIYLMPVTPVGQPTGSHPAFGSPYAVHDYYAINPSYGMGSDLTTLVNTAHGLGMKVILDEVLNHTSWDNALITQHPEYYVHSDGNPYNVNSIEQAFSFPDVAQLNYSTTQYGLQTYIANMLEYWLTTYNVDGFRFDTADDPAGPNRMIPASFWQALRPELESVKPDILMLGEEEDTALTTAPFELDYGWNLQSALQQAANSGNAAAGLQSAWQNQLTGWPTGTMHMSLLQDWDLPEDINEYGGAANTLDAAVFNFTINGVPLLFNGEEVGNDNSGNNTHNVIDWNSSNAAAFTAFYTQLIGLRDANAALQQGTMTWVTNSASSQVATYDRSGGGSEFLVEINFSGSPVSGTVSPPAGNAWTDVSVSGSPGGRSHIAPPNFSLQAHDFAIFQRSTTVTVPSAPTNLTATAGSSQVSLTWTASSGAVSYNVYRGTTAGGEGAAPIATGVTGASYVDTGLTNGTTYYYKVAAVNSAGTSGLSNEASAKPAYTGTPYGGTAAAIPGTVQFENFDVGGEGVAYHDTDAANNGGQYRTSEGVDIETCTDTGGGYDVGWTQPGEWMKYTVNVQTTRTYTLAFRVASGIASGTAGTFHVEDESGSNLTGAITVSSTGGWQTWTTLSGSAALTAGQHVLRVVIDSGNGAYNLNSMTFTGAVTAPAAPTGLTATAGNAQVSLSWTASSGATSYNVYRGTTAGGESGTPIATGVTGTSYANTGLTNGTTYYYKVAAVNSGGTSGYSNEASAKPSAPAYAGTPYSGTPAALPGTLDFDNYDKGGEGVAYHDTDTANDGGQYRTSEGVDIEACTDGSGVGNGYNVGWTQPGEWMNYTVNAQTAKSYALSFRVASGIASGTAGTFHIENQAGTNLTGEITVSSTGGWQNWTTLTGSATLPAGQQVLKMVIDSGNGAFNLEYVTFN
jgi:glycosidase/fibronectin type 3 domain-containing protein